MASPPPPAGPCLFLCSNAGNTRGWNSVCRWRNCRGCDSCGNNAVRAVHAKQQDENPDDPDQPPDFGGECPEGATDCVHPDAKNALQPPRTI